MLSVNEIGLIHFIADFRGTTRILLFIKERATPPRKLRRIYQASLIKAFSPCIANMAVMGTSLPLPGNYDRNRILGGSSPNVAIKYQMMIVVIT